MIRKRTLEMSLGLSVLLASAAGCEQPPAACTAGHGGFAVKYTLKPGSKTGTGTCDTLLGEVIGVEKYNPSDPSDPLKQDLSTVRLRIRSSTIGELTVAAEEAGVSLEGQSASSLGEFASATPDENNICVVPSMSEASISIPEGGSVPAANVTYAWSNVRIYVTTAHPGTQLTADLVFTDGECSATYTALGLWPAVSCEVEDADGNGTGAIDPALCSPEADPSAGRETGSGINPDFRDRVVCDPDLKLCILKDAPEGLR